MKTATLLSVLILATLFLNAMDNAKLNDIQYEGGSSILCGQVTDFNTGADIIFANVALYNKDNELIKGAITNLDGFFVIGNLPRGNYFLQVSHLGYKSSGKIAFTIHPENKQLQLSKLKLEPISNYIDEITIVSQKKNIKQRSEISDSIIEKRILSMYVIAL